MLPIRTKNKWGHRAYPLWLLIALLISAPCWSLGEKSWLAASSKNNLTLIDNKNNAELIIDIDEFPGVIRAAKNLQNDIEKVTNKKPLLSNLISEKSGDIVLIGTLGKSKFIDQLAANYKLDVSKIRDQWDAYQVQVIDNPFPQVKRALVIVGANKRGTMYGIYSLSEQIGVSPWYWWADVPTKKENAVVYR